MSEFFDYLARAELLERLLRSREGMKIIAAGVASVLRPRMQNLSGRNMLEHADTGQEPAPVLTPYSVARAVTVDLPWDPEALDLAVEGGVQRLVEDLNACIVGAMALEVAAPALPFNKFPRGWTILANMDSWRMLSDHKLVTHRHIETHRGNISSGYLGILMGDDFEVSVQHAPTLPGHRMFAVQSPVGVIARAITGSVDADIIDGALVINMKGTIEVALHPNHVRGVSIP